MIGSEEVRSRVARSARNAERRGFVAKVAETSPFNMAGTMKNEPESQGE